jgi:thiol-disulfide isomerase/thioredoxin
MLDFVRQEESYYLGIQPGQTGPSISGYTPDGNQVTLSELKGKFIFVDVWATWCGPCIGGLPDFKKLVEAYQGRNIVLMASHDICYLTQKGESSTSG